MDFIQFWVRLFWMILAMFLNLKALERYVTFRKAWWAKPLAFLAYWALRARSFLWETGEICPIPLRLFLSGCFWQAVTAF